MGQFIEDLRYRLKTSSGSLFLLFLKSSVGFVLGLTFALIGQQMAGYGTLAFAFVILTTMAVFHRLARRWNWVHVLVFAVICVLIGLLLRMYILVAPGA